MHKINHATYTAWESLSLTNGGRQPIIQRCFKFRAEEAIKSSQMLPSPHCKDKYLPCSDAGLCPIYTIGPSVITFVKSPGWQSALQK